MLHGSQAHFVIHNKTFHPLISLTAFRRHIPSYITGCMFAQSLLRGSYGVCGGGVKLQLVLLSASSRIPSWGLDLRHTALKTTGLSLRAVEKTMCGAMGIPAVPAS